jgi:hypothetical protein
MPRRRMEKWMYWHGFLTSALVTGEWSASRPGCFTARERAPGTHWIGGWVGPRAGLDGVEKRKFLTLPRLEFCCPARSQSLYRLSHPGSCCNRQRPFTSWITYHTTNTKGSEVKLHDSAATHLEEPRVLCCPVIFSKAELGLLTTARAAEANPDRYRNSALSNKHLLPTCLFSKSLSASLAVIITDASSDGLFLHETGCNTRSSEVVIIRKETSAPGR